MAKSETADRLKEIRERLEKATPGEWTNEGGEVGTDAPTPPPKGHENSPVCGCVLFEKDGATDDDCEFIAHSRSDVQYLLGLVERLDRKCELQEQLIDAMRRRHNAIWLRDRAGAKIQGTNIGRLLAELAALETERTKP